VITSPTGSEPPVRQRREWGHFVLQVVQAALLLLIFLAQKGCF
jgi:hypothetical protein